MALLPGLVPQDLSSFFGFQGYSKVWVFTYRPWGLASYTGGVHQNVPEVDRAEHIWYLPRSFLKTQDISVRTLPVFA